MDGLISLSTSLKTIHYSYFVVVCICILFDWLVGVCDVCQLIINDSGTWRCYCYSSLVSVIVLAEYDMVILE